MSPPCVVFVGPPGAGKSTVGKALAIRLGVSFCDVDAAIEAQVGKSVRELFVEDGEGVFRDLEEKAVAAALESEGGVLSLGGGAVMRESTRRLLSNHFVVYLHVDFPHAVKRVGLAADRPVLALNPRATLRQLLAERHGLYEEVATVAVDTSDRSVNEIVDEVYNLLRKKGEAQ